MLNKIKMMGTTSFPGENQILAKNIEPDTVYSIEKNKFEIHIGYVKYPVDFGHFGPINGPGPEF